MGIPSYFVHIVKNHSNIIKKYSKGSINIHNLYLDSNSLIYDSLKLIEFKNKMDFEEKIIKSVCEKLNYYINLINPSRKVLIAFDGVAPIAKLEQQRNRRYKTWYTKNQLSDDTIAMQEKKTWDTSAITPGTDFMEKLYRDVCKYFDNETKLDIMVSGANHFGEGEHKIFKYIRDNEEYHEDKNTVIYGLDADLIMLTLIHTKISPNLYLFRETPEFISSINSNLHVDEHYVMDIFELGEKINHEMTEISDKNCIRDYIFLCFLLGNDFMPHFPSINIRTNGIQILIDTYFDLFGNNKDKIVDNKKIYWINLYKLIKKLAENEEYNAIQDGKIRDKISKKFNNYYKFKNKEEELNARPLMDRTVEKYINIGDVGWQQRYYKELFGIEIDERRKKQICINYLEGLDWNFKYYTKDCPDWEWKYNYKYPPLLNDLLNFIPYFDTDFVEFKKANPVLPLVQLSYVLPRNSLDLLPKEVYEKLIVECGHLYRLDYEIQWAYCKYFWESHIVLPELDIKILKNLIN